MAVGAAEPAVADWYLRAGIGFDRPGKTNFTDRDCSSAAPAALYGCGTGGDGAPYRSVGDFGTVIPLELGLGLGVVRTRIGQTTMTFPATTTIVPGANRTGFAWMVTAGAAVALGERVTVDLAWRYTDLGAVHTGRGAGRVIWRDGSREPLPLDLAETWARLAGRGLRLSLRYGF